MKQEVWIRQDEPIKVEFPQFEKAIKVIGYTTMFCMDAIRAKDAQAYYSACGSYMEKIDNLTK